MNPDQIQQTYVDLAELHERQALLRLRDWFLLLAADTAQTAGKASDADQLLATLVRCNPHHFLKPFDSFAEALRSPEVPRYVGKLRRTYPPAKAAELLGADPGVYPVPPVGFVEKGEPEKILPPKATPEPKATHMVDEAPAPTMPATEDAAADVLLDDPGSAASPPEVPHPKSDRDRQDEGEAGAEIWEEEVLEITVSDVHDEPVEDEELVEITEPAEGEEVIEITETAEDDLTAAEEPAPALDHGGEESLVEEVFEVDLSDKPKPPPSRMPRVLRWLFRRRSE